ncbi:MAG: four helix bundle protein [Bacillota bacterium]
MKNYKELEVWQKAINLVIELYKITESFPNEERYGLVSQIQRAGVSVPANIAEGWGRGSTKEYIQYLRISRGSLAELETHLIIAQKLNYISEENTYKFEKEIISIGKMLNNLMKSLKKD